MAWDKGRASIYILRTAFGVDWSDRIRIIYAGDDVTDEDAMQALKGMAFSFRVVSSNLTQTSASMRWVWQLSFSAHDTSFQGFQAPTQFSVCSNGLKSTCLRGFPGTDLLAVEETTVLTWATPPPAARCIFQTWGRRQKLITKNLTTHVSQYIVHCIYKFVINNRRHDEASTNSGNITKSGNHS